MSYRHLKENKKSTMKISKQGVDLLEISTSFIPFKINNKSPSSVSISKLFYAFGFI